MRKLTAPPAATVFCGIDVSAETLSAAIPREDRGDEQGVFANTARGHQALIAWLGQHPGTARVSLEATALAPTFTRYIGHREKCPRSREGIFSSIPVYLSSVTASYP